MMHLFNLFGASFTLVMVLMVAFWVVYLFQRRGGIVDIAWGLAFILTAWAYFFLGTGNFLKMATMTAMVTLWAGRLSYHIYSRYRRSRSDDPRYVELLEKWDPDSARLYFLMMFIFQGVLVVILSIPFLLVSLGSDAYWSRFEAWGIAIWAIGLFGESLADKQLDAFKRDPANKGNVCQTGLWRYSRHPNYFFEAVVWFGFAIFALPSDWGWLAMISPLLMLVLLCKVSGIPLAEAQSLRSKGELYRDYQRTTSAFVPWFPKK
jgi:steroid 5-alpha reductase family enzyme